ncbi:hypothetical protein L4Z64_001452 [Pseudomonas aeruginosa]|nr:hypothetical protein [Pseudomonas aeruginosa]HCH7782833.1 hypothetical protein [Pseudomonas aeruginosa]
MTYTMLLNIYEEAKARVDDASLPADVRARSQETVDLCCLRIAQEGHTFQKLRELAAAE